ncbi:MAG: phospholipase D-like domain-containing protein [Opitutaceae bacterium]|jgi:superfamily II DNA or RNA helicase|nr:phospholipase D-like domain-containing protein [Opitutaceae bacterium]
MSDNFTASGPLFIVDNSDTDWKVRNYLLDWCDLSNAMDIATGYFEIGALLAFDDKWQAVDRIRILMGDEVSLRTKRAFAEGLRNITNRLDASLECEKARDDFLNGVPAIVEAVRSGKIQCRVYRRDKFHAKAYLTHGRAAVVGSFGLVGSSNFTSPGISDNVELNIQVRGPEVGLLQEWYEKHWNDAGDITPDILRTIERHTLPRTPFEVWFRALHEFCNGHELTPDEWDSRQSTIFPRLAKYQRDAYKNLIQIAHRYGAAFLCDGVGLGKTYVGLMLIERFVMHESRRVVLFAPKAAREDVWEPAIENLLPDLNSGFVNLVVYNHTDLQRKGKWPRDMKRTLRDADIILIDEAHHFRNPGIKGEGARDPSRYRLLQDYLHQEGAREKQVFFLTATPINNSVHDFRHILELVTNGNERHFSEARRNLGIHSLRGHFVQLEKKLFAARDGQDPDSPPDIHLIERALHTDSLFGHLVVQRSRSYVKESQRQLENGQVLFPERDTPRVVPYKLKATYGRLLDSVERAFNKEKPLFVLGIYYPLSYWKGVKEHPEFGKFDEGRQKQVVSLIRTQFLKRFESSARAFEMSCWRLLKKLLAWIEAHTEPGNGHNQRRLERWKLKNAGLIGYVHAHQQELWGDNDAEPTEDFLTDEEIDLVEKLDPDSYNIDDILDDTYDDLDQLAEFLGLVGEVKPEKDDKLKALIRLLKSDKTVAGKKLLLFTEFADTARYLETELKKAGIPRLERIDGASTQRQRSNIIRRFSPYYNGADSAALAASGENEITLLLATDVLSEGLNLQDASRLINYDIHWNPVRLMQRIGRVDRRMNPAIEQKLVAGHPALKKDRGRVAFWNFLPPDELDELLRLYQKVNRKVVTISRTLGIEHGKLLKPDDEYELIKEINEQFDGEQSEPEKLRLEYDRLVKEHPGLAATLDTLPLKLFSGKQHPPSPGTAAANTPRAVFFCFRIPRPDPDLVPTETGELRWTDSAGFSVWLYADATGETMTSDPAAIAVHIRSRPDTPRHCIFSQTDLSALRKKAEKEIIKNHLRTLQAPTGVTPILKCWMELN